MNKTDVSYSFESGLIAINETYVASINRRRGVATSMLQKGETNAKSNQCDTAVVSANAEKVTLSFWRVNGYNVVNIEVESIESEEYFLRKKVQITSMTSRDKA